MKMGKKTKKYQSEYKIEIEKCVVCGSKTENMFATPILKRQFYIEGVGQLCRECYYDIYIKNHY